MPTYSDDGQWWWDGRAWQPVTPQPPQPPKRSGKAGLIVVCAVLLVLVISAGAFLVPSRRC
ncbi:hypothetical protein [Kribbella caucasensis]|uniref:hypothetical protein n=1 Tax=Kribbella caucasensis TaxID=2512215 RepID=UPI00105CA40A|nr:hypothetical protein [Kribbella sp. VKM Ac-2527]